MVKKMLKSGNEVNVEWIQKVSVSTRKTGHVPNDWKKVVLKLLFWCIKIKGGVMIVRITEV